MLTHSHPKTHPAVFRAPLSTMVLYWEPAGCPPQRGGRITLGAPPSTRVDTPGSVLPASHGAEETRHERTSNQEPRGLLGLGTDHPCIHPKRSLSCNIYDHALCYMYMTLQNNLCLEKSWEREKRRRRNNMPVRAKLSEPQDPSKCVVSRNSEKQNWGKGHFKVVSASLSSFSPKPKASLGKNFLPLKRYSLQGFSFGRWKGASSWVTPIAEQREQGPRCWGVDQHHDKDPVEAKSSEARAPGRVGSMGGGGAGASRLR